MPITFKQLIDAFVNGADNGYSGTVNNPGNLTLKNGKLYHYDTVIAERVNKQFVLNLSQYSLQTGKVQKMLKGAIPDNLKITVKKVPKDYKGSLTAYIK